MDLWRTLIQDIYLEYRQYPGEVFYYYQSWWIYLQWYLLSLISLWLRKQILGLFVNRMLGWNFYAITVYSNLVGKKIKFLFSAWYCWFHCYRWLLSLIRKHWKIDENENIIYRIRTFSLITFAFIILKYVFHHSIWKI